MPIVMGRKTFESFGSKPLNGRLNIVVTRQENFTAEGIVAVHSFDDAVFLAQEHDYKELMILGAAKFTGRPFQKLTKSFLPACMPCLKTLMPFSRYQ